MDSLMAKSGFSSVAVQWVNSALLLVLYLLVTRHAENRGSYRAWLRARVWMLVALTVVLGWFYLLPTLQAEAYATVRGAEPLALATYLWAKGVYWGMLALGIAHLRADRVARQWTLRIKVGALLFGLIAMSFEPSLEAAIWFQALVAIPALVFGIASLGHLPKSASNLGSRLMRFVLGLHLAVWVAYGVAFFGHVFDVATITDRPAALLWVANAYTDTLLDSVLTFSILVVLIEGTHEKVERDTSARIRRVSAQQSQVVALLKMPEIAAGNFPDVARAAAKCAADALEVERVSVWRFSEDRQELVCSVLFSRSTGTYSTGSVLRADSLPAYFSALETGTFIDARDARNDPRTAELCEPYLRDHGIGSMLDVKIRGTTEFIGVLCHEHVGGPRDWHDDEIAFTGFVADQLGQTLANQRARAAERQRDELESQLRQSQKMEAVGQLAGGIAHDFNNMLCAIMGHASLAQPDAPLEFKDSLEQISAASERAAELTRKLLSFSRHQVLEKDVVEVNDIVRSTIDLLRRVAEESIEIETELSDDAGRVLVDSSELEQVLLNICNNARDAMPGGGRLRVVTERRPASGSAASPDREEHVCISISDTGSGIPADILDRVFEPFFTTKPEGEGTGLGLATSYGIVEQHGGKIHVESEPGAGTVFEVTLPLVQTPATVRAPQPTRPASGGNEILLVVEDEPAVRSLMSAILESAGYEVLRAEDGAVALEVHRTHADRIDAVLLDSVLPKVSGAEVFAQIRTSAPGTPVICTSGYLGRDPVSDFDGVLSKPFTRDELLVAIRTALDTAATKA